MLDRGEDGGVSAAGGAAAAGAAGGAVTRGCVVILIGVFRQAQKLGERIYSRSLIARQLRIDSDAGVARRLKRIHRRGVAAFSDIGESQRIARERFAVGRDVDGASIREYSRQFLARHARPHPDAAGVHVHEGRPGLRIETDATALQPQADDAQLLQRYAGNVKIHGVAEHMLAETRDARTAVAQHRIGLRRTVTANDLNRLLGNGFALHFPHQIDEVRIHAGLFAASPIAQEPVQLLQRGLVVLAVALIGDGDVFAGVQMMQRNRPRVAFGGDVLQGP